MGKIFNKTRCIVIAILIMLITIIFTIDTFAATINNPEIKPETKIYTDKIKVGDVYKYVGENSKYFIFKNVDDAIHLRINKKVGALTKNQNITVKEKNGNALKIGNNQYIYYGATGANLFNKQAVAVKNVKLKSSNGKIEIGQKTTIYSTVSPENATNKSLTYTSSNNKVATVDKNGIVKGIKQGTARITVKSNNNKKAEYTVTVTKKPVITVAKELKAKCAKLVYNKGTIADLSKTTPVNKGSIDCSLYTSWVIYEYGKQNGISEYRDKFKASKDTGSMLSWFKNNPKLVKNIGNLRVVKSSLKAGDILIKSGHVEIFSHISNGKIYVYNCGNDNSVQRTYAAEGNSSINTSKYTVYRLIK